jgi:hypothetical protein
MKNQKPHHDFALKDCTLAAIATGQNAQNLREFRNRMREVNLDSVYYHFWGGLLRPRFDDPQYHNDFAIWARYGLQDAVLAERLGIIDPNIFQGLESLRQELVELIEQRLDEVEWVPWAKAGNQFNFVRSQVVVFDTNARIRTPRALSEALPGMSVGSIFFHFIDARRRSSNNMDDFRNWLTQNFSGYEELNRRLAQVDPFFSSLIELRGRLKEVFWGYFGG